MHVISADNDELAVAKSMVWVTYESKVKLWMDCRTDGENLILFISGYCVTR